MRPTPDQDVQPAAHVHAFCNEHKGPCRVACTCDTRPISTEARNKWYAMHLDGNLHFDALNTRRRAALQQFKVLFGTIVGWPYVNEHLHLQLHFVFWTHAGCTRTMRFTSQDQLTVPVDKVEGRR